MSTKPARAVTVIPPIAQRFTSNALEIAPLKRVAAYARVSTDNEEQLSSYEAQVDYYTRFIQGKEEWQFIEVYADEGISATSTKHRDGFNRMIRDALDDKIDMIITKSVSRFARNTVDTLITVRQLKEKGVEVYFEKENIYTLDSRGELLITIMSSLAQEESRSISENVTWGKRKQFADGKVSMPYKFFLGYEKGEDGLPKIVESEAKVVRLIYKLFLEGKTSAGIAKYLMDNLIPSPMGKKRWNATAIDSMLTNEKYKGDAILQKTFSLDFLTKKRKINEGEIPQYYVENSHPAIITPEAFDLVQHEIKKRKVAGLRQSGVNAFSSKIICGECGGFYGCKLWHSTDKYRKTVWRCNQMYMNNRKCESPVLDESMIHEEFLGAFNNLIENKDEHIQNYVAIIESLTDTKLIDAQIEKLQTKCDDVFKELHRCVDENAHSIIDQSEYQQRYDALVKKYDVVKNKLAKISEEKLEHRVKRERIEAFLKMLEESDLITKFDEVLWAATFEKVVVQSTDEMVFTFKDGTELVWGI